MERVQGLPMLERPGKCPRSLCCGGKKQLSESEVRERVSRTMFLSELLGCSGVKLVSESDSDVTSELEPETLSFFFIILPLPLPLTVPGVRTEEGAAVP